MASPTGVYLGFSASDLLVMIRETRERIAGRQIVSMSGAGKSVTYSTSANATDDLRELMFAYRRLTGGNVRRTYFDASGQSGLPAATISSAGAIPDAEENIDGNDDDGVIDGNP